jgi:hypothetical protein
MNLDYLKMPIKIWNIFIFKRWLQNGFLRDRRFDYK